MADFLDILEAALLDRFQRDIGQKGNDQPRTLRSTEPKSWKLSGKLVRLDVVIMASHLMIARICVRSLPQAVEERIFSFKEYVAKLAANFVLAQTLFAAAKGSLAAINYVGTVFEAEVSALQSENAIRRNGLRTERELSALFMGANKPKHRRRARWVATRGRHPVKRQRRPNKTWRQPLKN